MNLKVNPLIVVTAGGKKVNIFHKLTMSAVEEVNKVMRETFIEQLDVLIKLCLSRSDKDKDNDPRLAFSQALKMLGQINVLKDLRQEISNVFECIDYDLTFLSNTVNTTSSILIDKCKENGIDYSKLVSLSQKLIEEQTLLDSRVSFLAVD
jgi:hypothetical protein